MRFEQCPNPRHFSAFLPMLTEFCNVLKVSWRKEPWIATTRTDMTPAGSYFWQQFWRSWRCELLLVIFRFAPASQWDLPFKSHHVVATGNAGWHKKGNQQGNTFPETETKLELTAKHLNSWSWLDHVTIVGLNLIKRNFTLDKCHKLWESMRCDYECKCV